MKRAISLVTLATLATLATATFAVAGCNVAPPLDVAPGVDLTRFQGKWYEIASLPRVTQTGCYGTTAFYTPAADGSFQFVNQCNVASTKGPLKTTAMTATVPDRATPAKLALDVGGYSGDYWILEVGADYEYAVVGHPSRDYLWILSRTPALDSTTEKGLLERAQKSHFDTSKLQYTPQPPAGERVASSTPVGTVPEAMKTGCSASGGTGTGAGGTWSVWCVGLLLAAVWGRGRSRVAGASAADS